jgi:hypothetical protein
VFPVGAFPVACGAAFCATSFELANKHGRHPFGDRRALIWWCLIGLADVLVAGLALVGGIATSGVDGLQAFGFLGWIVIGILIPLGLRSPVRQVRVGGQLEAVGLTEYYDRFRIQCDRRLDDRITSLRRNDRLKVREAIESQGWTANQIAAKVPEHLRELRTRSTTERAKIEKSIKSALSFPAEKDRLDGLLKIMGDEGLRSVIDEMKSTPPS